MIVLKLENVKGKEMISGELINLLKEKKKFTKDGELVGYVPATTKGIISELKSGKRPLTDEQALFIAKECGLNPEWVLAEVAADRAKTEELKEIWGTLAKKLSRTVTAAALAVSLVFCGVQHKDSTKAVFA